MRLAGTHAVCFEWKKHSGRADRMQRPVSICMGDSDEINKCKRLPINTPAIRAIAAITTTNYQTAHANLVLPEGGGGGLTS